MTAGGRRRAGVFAALCVVASLVGAPASADEQFSFERLAGADRYATAAEIGRAVAGTGTRVLLATGETYPDALAAAHLAGARSAPILLVTRTAVPAATADALRDLGATSVTVLGGTGAIDDAVLTELRADGYTVDRIAGTDRYETARLVAERAGADAVGIVDGSRTAIVAGGSSFAEAMAAGPLAYHSGLPILLTAADGLSAPTASALRTLQIERVLVLGGTAQVGLAVEDDLSALGMAVDRLGSADRPTTAAALADFAVESLGFPTTRVNLARGDDFADALVAGALGGSTRAVTLLTASPTSIGSATTSWLRANAPTLTGGVIFGGTAAVSSSVEAAATSAAGGQVTSGAGGSASAITAAITGGPADGATSADSTPSYSGTATASGASVRRITVSVDGALASTTGVVCTGCGSASATWELTSEVLADGPHTFTFRAVDSTGASSAPVSTSITVDTVAPTFLSVSATRGSTLVPAELSEPIRCSTVSVADFTARLDGVATTIGEARCLGTAASTIELVIGRAPEAQDVLEVHLGGIVMDLGGNVAVGATRSVVVANVGAPIVTIVEPADGLHTNIRRPLFAGHATSDRTVAAVEARIGTRPFASTDVVCDGCGGSDTDWSYRANNDLVTGGDYPDGVYRFEVRARDDAGVLSDVVSRTVTIDGTAPVWPASSSTTPRPLTATAGSPTITASFVDTNGIACASVAISDFTAKVGGQATAITAVSCAAPASNVIELTLAKAPTTLQAVELTISAGALADRAGNTAPTAASTRSVTV